MCPEHCRSHTDDLTVSPCPPKASEVHPGLHPGGWGRTSQGLCANMARGSTTEPQQRPFTGVPPPGAAQPELQRAINQEAVTGCLYTKFWGMRPNRPEALTAVTSAVGLGHPCLETVNGSHSLWGQSQGSLLPGPSCPFLLFLLYFLLLPLTPPPFAPRTRPSPCSPTGPVLALSAPSPPHRPWLCGSPHPVSACTAPPPPPPPRPPCPTPHTSWALSVATCFKSSFNLA